MTACLSALPLPQACSDDLYQRFALGEAMPSRLPRDLCAALDALQADAPLRQAIGLACCEQFVQIKRDEWAAYSRHISTWEWLHHAAAH